MILAGITLHCVHNSKLEVQTILKFPFTLYRLIWLSFLFFWLENSVHLVELKGTGELYAMKAMEKTMMLNRNKVYDGEWISFREGKLETATFILFLSLTTCSIMQAHRACIEREIISLLDHPFLPTLYASFQVYVFLVVCIMSVLPSHGWSVLFFPQTSTHVCLITDFCPGGELFALLDRQPMKILTEDSARYPVSSI